MSACYDKDISFVKSTSPPIFQKSTSLNHHVAATGQILETGEFACSQCGERTCTRTSTAHHL